MVSNLEYQPLNPQPTPIDQIEWMSQYIIGSFYFSQGTTHVQDVIDNYSVVNFKDRWDQLNSVKNEVSYKAIGAVSDFLALGDDAHVPLTRDLDIARQVGFRISNLLHFQQRPDNNCASPEYILNKLIIADHANLFPIVKHYGASERGMRTIIGSPRFGRSILLEHLVDQKDARHDVFNKLFSDIRDFLAEGNTDKLSAQLIELANKEAELRQVPVRDIGAFLLSLQRGVEA